jgi:integrase
VKAPSERQLAQVASELRKLAPAAQRAVGGGVQMRLDKEGNRRFQFRVRVSNSSSGQPGGTFGTWQEAYDERVRREAADAQALLGLDANAAAMRDWEILLYAEKVWWPDCTLHLDVATRIDYRNNGLKSLMPHIQGITLAQLESEPLRIDRIKQAVAADKTYAQREGGKPILHKAAADRALKVLSIICEHATERNVLVRNPMRGVRRLNRRRGAASNATASHRPVLRSEIKPQHSAALAGSGMLGDPVLILQRRLIPELIVCGMRPSDILATRPRWWRDKNGPKERLVIDSAVKDLGGYLIEGEPKTGERDLYLPPAMIEWLEWLYQLQGCPDPDSLTFPNCIGGLLDWGNFRRDVWYPALHRAGISDGPTSAANDAFYPYTLRHVGVTVMAHAERPEGGTYSPGEVAYQFGHSEPTLQRVYLHVLTDIHGIGGLTMDQIIRNGRRHVWGPMPGDPDYHDIEYDLLEAAELTGISRNGLAARIGRRSIPGVKRKGKYYVTHFHLAWHGLIPAAAKADNR